MECRVCQNEEAKIIIGRTVLCGDCADNFGELLTGSNYTCPVCQTDRDSIIFTGMAGCPGCYKTFAREIGLITGLPGKANEPVRN